jgi:hypothetical protein
MAALVYSLTSKPGSVQSFPRFPLLIEKIPNFLQKSFGNQNLKPGMASNPRFIGYPAQEL